MAVPMLLVSLASAGWDDAPAILNRAEEASGRLSPAARRTLLRDLAVARQLVGDRAGA